MKLEKRDVAKGKDVAESDVEEVKKELENAGSSMEKVLKCNVYLNDLKDYAAMNEVFRGKFGEQPPVRTTIAAAGGIASCARLPCRRDATFRWTRFARKSRLTSGTVAHASRW